MASRASLIDRVTSDAPSRAKRPFVALPDEVKVRSAFGPREQNKAEKRGRIKFAAREIFSEHGYDRATLRLIADRAGVALGTISLYANDKRDLVLLMYNDEVAGFIERGARQIRDRNSVLDNLVLFGSGVYHGYAADVGLARIYLQLNFYADGINFHRLAANRRLKHDVIRGVIERAQVTGEARVDIDPERIATAILLLHRAAVRDWITDPSPNAVDGINRWRDLLALQFEGFRNADRSARRKMVAYSAER